MRTPILAALGLALAVFSGATFAADVVVKGPWVRATVAGQMATGAFMDLSSRSGAKLLSASSPIAGVVEIHSMTTEAGVMQMRPVAAIDLPAGKAVALAPGGFHIMMMDLKQGVKKGDVVALTLKLKASDGTIDTLEVRAEGRALTSGTGNH